MRQRAPKRPADVRRRMILESAQSVFAEGGYANRGAEDVAKAAGVAPSAIYRYYASKRDLYLAALRDAGPRLRAIWKGTAEQSGDPLETAWRVGLDYYDHVQSRSAYARLWFQALSEASDPEVRATLAENYVATVDLLAAQLEAGQAGGAVRPDVDARVAAWHFMAIGLTFDLVHHLGLDQELDRQKVEAWGKLYLESIRGDRDGKRIKAGGREPRGTVPLRQSRGEVVAGGGGDPLPSMPEGSSHPLGGGAGPGGGDSG